MIWQTICLHLRLVIVRIVADGDDLTNDLRSSSIGDNKNSDKAVMIWQMLWVHLRLVIVRIVAGGDDLANDLPASSIGDSKNSDSWWWFGLNKIFMNIGRKCDTYTADIIKQEH